jgi:3-O-methylgallate 3,4-dioxygenase
MGDDENEWFQGAATPPLAVYRGATWTWGPTNTPYPVAVDLTDHITAHLRGAGYTVEVFDEPVDGKPMPHSFGLHYARLLKSPVPMVPILVNIHFPPTQPSMVEQYRLGQEIRKALLAWGQDQRIAVLADGGLSIGVVREDLDRRLLDALQRHDVATLGEIPYKWIQGPCGEIFNWIGAAGVLEDLEMKVWDYVPTYRSPAGTGCGNAFATWS